MTCFGHLDKYGELVALIDESGAPVSYSRFLAQADGLAAQIGRRCLVFILGANRLEAVAAYVGFLRAKVVPVMLSADLDPALLADLMALYRPAFIYGPREAGGAYAVILNVIRKSKKVVTPNLSAIAESQYITSVIKRVTERSDWQEGPKCLTPGQNRIFGQATMALAKPAKLTMRIAGAYELTATGLEEDYQLHPDLALLLTTSGSTGSPKLVRQSYENIRSNTAAIIEYLNITQSERAITTLPLYYTYGLSILNTHLSAGARVILTDKTVLSKDFWQLLKAQEATTFGGVPYTYEMLKKLRFQNLLPPSLRYLTQAGGRLQPELLLELVDICEDKGLKFIVMYGQTEATARMSWLPWEVARAKNASIGQAIPGGRFWLADEAGQPVEGSYQVGELVYDGPNVTLGYASGRHDLAQGDERGGRLFTGDLARRDEDGYYYLVGRKKRFLKLFGSRVNLDEVETLLKREKCVCACGGTDDHLVVYLENWAECHHVVEDYLAQRLALSRAGFKVVAIDALPRTEAGKIKYAALPGES